MEMKEFKEKVFAKAQAEGFSEYEIYYSKNDSISINVYKGEVDKYSVSTTMGVSFRGVCNGRMGYAYTEILNDSSADMVVISARENSQSVENEDKEFIYGGKDSYAEINIFDAGLSEVSADKKIKLALELEQQVKKKCDKVVNMGFCGVGSSEMEIGIMNSHGLDLSHKSNYIYGAVVPVISDGSRMYNEMAYKISNDYNTIIPEVLAEEAVRETLARLGASSVKSGTYKTLLRNDVAASLLATFSGAFSADNVQKGLSLLKNKVGTAIAARCINISDDPLMEGGLASAPFDAEGVPAYKKSIVSEGSLYTLLYNLKAADKDGVKTTGNASKASYSSPVTVSPSNFYVEKGEHSFAELLESIGEGLLITDLEGIHAGANPVTGDFSLAAKGFVISGGKVERPVEQITVAGNFFKLLENVEAVGDDLKFIMPSGSSYFGSPTLAVSELSIAGI